MNEKTLVFDNGGAMDGNLVAALMNGNNRNGYGMGYGWEWMWMILLWAIWGGNGWGGFGGRGGLQNLPAELNGDVKPEERITQLDSLQLSAATAVSAAF